MLAVTGDVSNRRPGAMEGQFGVKTVSLGIDDENGFKSLPSVPSSGPLP